MKFIGDPFPPNIIKANLLAMLAILATMIVVAGCDEQGVEKPEFTIAVVTNNPNGLKNISGFQEGMTNLGYVEGRNVTYVGVKKPVSGKDLEAALTGFVNDQVDLIFTAGTPTGVAAHRLTKGSNVPVVFGVIADPVRAGVMNDLTTPGGNMTGVKLNQNQALRLELFLQIVPEIKTLAVLYNPNDSAPVSAVNQIKSIIRKTSIELLLIESPDNQAVTDGLQIIGEKADSIFLVPDSIVNKRIKDIVKIANTHKLPLSGPSSAQIRQGGLMSYGIDHNEVGIQAARIADQILKGAKAGTIPVETASSYLGLNLKTAKSIGIDLSDQIILKAREVIRSVE